ncbi:MAG: LysM peptidoglycan-binding domain-containing protein [Verrucomicrobia bacterium]|nr:LysM peptidoglycan-binding domain-containing protein [Verrucomicrobiota bacterium]
MSSLPPFPTTVSIGLSLITALALCACGGGGKLPPQGAAAMPAPSAGPGVQGAAPAAVPSDKPLVDYKIQEGDSLWTIARAYKTSVKEIKAANQLTSDFIVAGNTIRVPSGLAEGVAPSAPGKPAPVTAEPQGLPQPAVVDTAAGLVQ